MTQKSIIENIANRIITYETYDQNDYDLQKLF